MFFQEVYKNIDLVMTLVYLRVVAIRLYKPAKLKRLIYSLQAILKSMVSLDYSKAGYGTQVLFV